MQICRRGAYRRLVGFVRQHRRRRRPCRAQLTAQSLWCVYARTFYSQPDLVRRQPLRRFSPRRGGCWRFKLKVRRTGVVSADAVARGSRGEPSQQRHFHPYHNVRTGSKNAPPRVAAGSAVEVFESALKVAARTRRQEQARRLAKRRNHAQGEFHDAAWHIPVAARQSAQSAARTTAAHSGGCFRTARSWTPRVEQHKIGAREK